jgi:hypothetical protein
MGKSTIRLLALVIYAMPMVAAPAVPPANAATDSSKHSKKHAKKIQRGPAVQSAKSQNPFPPMDEDPDRRAGGGGGY